MIPRKNIYKKNNGLAVDKLLSIVILCEITIDKRFEMAKIALISLSVWLGQNCQLEIKRKKKKKNKQKKNKNKNNNNNNKTNKHFFFTVQLYYQTRTGIIIIIQQLS